MIYKLILHPQDVDYAPLSWNDIHAALIETGFLGKALGDNTNKFYIGENFLQLITFMGCSPHIEVEPPKNGSENYCHVEFSEIYTEVQFRFLQGQVFARCPKCRKRDPQWQQAISAWQVSRENSEFTCSICGGVSAIYDLGWRHTAGFAKAFIEIYSIYPNEGIPTDNLLNVLEQASGQCWGYFYYI